LTADHPAESGIGFFGVRKNLIELDMTLIFNEQLSFSKSFWILTNFISILVVTYFFMHFVINSYLTQSFDNQLIKPYSK